MPSDFKSLVIAAANRYGIGHEVKAAEICQVYRRLAPQIMRDQVLDHTFPKFYKGNILTVAAVNSAWAQEIHMNKTLLLERINQEIKPDELKNIRVIIEKNKFSLT